MKIIGYLNKEDLTTPVIAIKNNTDCNNGVIGIDNAVIIKHDSLAFKAIDLLYKSMNNKTNTISDENIIKVALKTIDILIRELDDSFESFDRIEMEKKLHYQLSSKHFTHVIYPRSKK